MQQFIFDLKIDENYKLEDYVICNSNVEIISYLKKWPSWSSKIIFIYGNPKSGKTHLAHIWRNYTNAEFISYNDIYPEINNDIVSKNNSFVIDDIEKLFISEINLFHLINIITEQKKYLLITSQTHQKNLDLKIIDLRSRLTSFLGFQIPAISDELFKLMAFKYFTDKHLVVNDKVISYMLSRAERSFTYLKQIINMIDKKALVEKRNISISLVRQILENTQKV